MCFSLLENGVVYFFVRYNLFTQTLDVESIVLSSPRKGHIFISYRRADSEGYAGRIYDRITPHFGADAVFMDVDTIDAGVDFVRVLEEAVQSCDVLVALIGRRWLDLKDENGVRRLDNHEDFVRIEIATALGRDIRVIPVLVGGASMPGSTELPENLQPLARRNALTVDHATFHADMNRLIAHLERAMETAETSKALRTKRLHEEQVRKEYQTQIEKLLHQVNTAINLSDWKLAQEKLKDILAIDTGDIEAQAKLGLVEEKLAALEEKKKVETREREEEKQKRQKRERETAARARAERLAREKATSEKKARQATLRNFIVGGIALLFILYLISTIEFPSQPEPPPPTNSNLATATSFPKPTATVVEVTFVPISEFDVGSTMVSEKDNMVMVYVPAGEFQMGSENGTSYERPIHTVYLDAFWIDQTEVTNAMYAKCVDTGICNPPSSTKSYMRDSYFGNPEFENYPVIYVSWNDAKTYCEWAGRRLLTESEWEKAAVWDEDQQAPRMYPWGDTIDESYTNYNRNIDDTTAVGSYEKGVSFYGVYDMAGNVGEWVADWYDAYPGGDKSATPLFGQTYRVQRGGAWYNLEEDMRSAYRFWFDPVDTYEGIGFRCSSSVAAP